MPLDYRSELARPISLVLAGLAVLGWVVALGLGLSGADEREASEATISRLQQSEAGLRTQLAEHQRSSGAVADLQNRSAAAQQQLTQLTQAKEQAKVQLNTLRQTLTTTQQHLTDVSQTRDQVPAEVTALHRSIAAAQQQLSQVTQSR